MDKLFVELYKRVNMDATNEQIDMRMRSIKNILNDINEEMIEGIVKVFAKTPVLEEFYNQFGNYFYEEDYSFDLDNKEELSILAGYILHQLLEDEEWREKVAILIVLLSLTTLIISKKPGNTGISRDIRTEFTTDLLLSD